MSIRSSVFAVLGLVMLAGSTSGCSTLMKSVTAIGPNPSAEQVWVDIQTDKEVQRGVYRCVVAADGSRPVCTKAVLVTK